MNDSDVDDARFVRAALVTGRLEHPSIVPVYEAGRWPSGEPFYTMKRVGGRSLRDLVKETRDLGDHRRGGQVGSRPGR